MTRTSERGLYQVLQDHQSLLSCLMIVIPTICEQLPPASDTGVRLQSVLFICWLPSELQSALLKCAESRPFLVWEPDLLSPIQVRITGIQNTLKTLARGTTIQDPCDSLQAHIQLWEPWDFNKPWDSKAVWWFIWTNQSKNNWRRNCEWLLQRPRIE